MTRIECPTCGRMKPEFAIVNGRCREDMRDETRASAHRPELTLADIRGLRNIKLAQCDWTQAQDAPLNALEKVAWATYRQALRDVPETFAGASPQEVVWPTPPG